MPFSVYYHCHFRRIFRRICTCLEHFRNEMIWNPTGRPMRPHRPTNETPQADQWKPQADEALALPLAVIHLVTVSTLGQVPQGAGPREAAEPLAVNTAVLRFSLTGIIPRHLQWHRYKTMDEDITHIFQIRLPIYIYVSRIFDCCALSISLMVSNPQPQSIFFIRKMLFILQII